MNYKLNFFYTLSPSENTHRLVIHSQEVIYQVLLLIHNSVSKITQTEHKQNKCLLCYWLLLFLSKYSSLKNTFIPNQLHICY